MWPFEKQNLRSIAVAIALLSALLAVAAKNMVVDLDLFHEMALYRQMESEGAMPTTDSFAYTPTNVPVVHHEWATGAVMYWICVKFGWGSAGVVMIKYLLTFAVGLGCYWYARRQAVPLALFAVLAPIAINLGGWMAFTNIRAQLFTLFFLVVMLLLIDLDRRGKRWWIAIWLPMVIAWGNIHGGVVSGIGLMGCYGIARTLEAWFATRSLVKTLRSVAHLLATGVATAVLLLVNPYGWRYIPYLIRAIRMPRPLIPEWNPIWQLETNDALMFWCVSIAIAVLAYRFKKISVNQNGASGQSTEDGVNPRETSWQHDLFTPLALLLTAWMAAKHYRHGSLYAVTWLCLVPPLLNRTTIAETIENLWSQHHKAIGVVATGIAIVAMGFAVQAKFWQLRVPGQRAYPGEPILVYPVGPVEFMAQQQFRGNLFVPFNIGAYVSWKLAPQVKVSIDSRYEVAYPKGALESNLAFYHGLDQWQEIVRQHRTDAVLIPFDQPVADQIDHLTSVESDWSIWYRDAEFVLLIRRDLGINGSHQYRQTEAVQGVFP